MVEGSLYRMIAKDYNPKKAEMAICQHIEKLEKRIEKLEKYINLETDNVEDKVYKEPIVFDSTGTTGYIHGTTDVISQTYETGTEPKKRGRKPKEDTMD